MPLELKPGFEGVAEMQRAKVEKAVSEKNLTTAASPKKAKKKTVRNC